MPTRRYERMKRRVSGSKSLKYRRLLEGINRKYSINTRILSTVNGDWQDEYEKLFAPLIKASATPIGSYGMYDLYSGDDLDKETKGVFVKHTSCSLSGRIILLRR